METFEPFLFLLLVAVYLLFNYVSQWVNKRAREKHHQERQQAANRPVTPLANDPLEDVFWGSRPPSAPVADSAAVATPPPSEAMVAAAAPSPPRPARTRLFRSRQELRHAIVAMTVLGPCRALAPYDPEQAGPRPSPARDST